jgi:hypothetical protein
MGPRKRSRPNPEVELTPKANEEVGETSTREDTKPANQDGLIHNTSTTKSVVDQDVESDSASTVRVCDNYICASCHSLIKQSQQNRSWYAGGTWPRIQKSTPSIKVARETILADRASNPVAADFSRFEPPKKAAVVPSSPGAPRPPSMYLGKSKETLNMTLPENKPLAEDKLPAGSEILDKSPAVASPNMNTPIPSDDTQDLTRPVTASRWLGWLGASATGSSVVSQHDAQPNAPAEPSIKPISNSHTESLTDPLPSPGATSANQEVNIPTLGASWFGFWSSATQPKVVDDVRPIDIAAEADCRDNTGTTENLSSQNIASPAPGSTWAFWSKEPRNSAKAGTKTDEHGELAVSGESSQNNPTLAHTSLPKEIKGDAPKQNKRVNAQSCIDEASQKTDAASKSAVLQSKQTTKKDVYQKLSQAEPEQSQKATPLQSSASLKPLPPNLLLPSFRGTYHLMDNPSIIKQIARLLMHGRQPPTSHVHLLRDPPRIKKALAIGVHGLFPAALLRTVIGQPTGTSIRFANHAAAAIHRWAEQHSCDDIEVEKIALEGEGKIAERVDNLWKLLLNWIDHIRTADFILVACHSQGVPVALMLVAKLIEFGVVTSAKIGVCAMGKSF